MKKNFSKCCKLIFFLCLLLTVVFGCDKKQSKMNIENKNNALLINDEFNKQLLSFSFDSKQNKEKIKSSKNPEIKKLLNLKTEYNITKNESSKMSDLLKTYFVSKLNKNENLNSTLTASSNNIKESNKQKKSVVENSAIEKEFVVSDWGPKGVSLASMQTPFIYVTFNLPVKSLSPLQDNFDGKDFFTITPSIKGKYKVVGTRQINFFPEEELDSITSYRIEVNKKLQSSTGIKISGDLIFETKEEPFVIASVRPGASIEESYYYNSDAGVPLEKAGTFLVYLNSKCSAETVKKNIEVLYLEKNVDYTVTPFEEYFDEELEEFVCTKKQLSNLHQIKLNAKFAINKRITIQVVDYKNKKRTVTQEEYYDTIAPLQNEKIEYNSYLQSIDVRFNQPLQKETVLKNIKIIPEINLTEDDLNIYRSSLSIKSKLLKHRQNYKVIIKKDIQDIYGQTLQNDVLQDIYIIEKNGAFNFYPDNGTMLESQYAAKYLLQHRNLINAKYFVERTENIFDETEECLDDENYGINLSNFKSLENFDDDQFYFEEINLDEYLKQGLGFIKITALYGSKYYQSYYKKFNTNFYIKTKNIQVTNLGVTTRVGYNKLICIVRKLSDNTPVKNATVYFCNKKDVKDAKSLEEIKSKSFSSVGKTDKNGYCQIEFTQSEILKIQEMSNYQATILVSSENDNVICSLDGHDTWQFGIDKYDFQNLKYQRNYVHIFTDRGIYKPGEVVTFKGLVRQKKLDKLEVKKGSVTVELVDSWGKIIESSELELNENGSFFDSFVIPQDVKPSNFMLVVKQGKSTLGSTRLNVAYFEKVKYEISTTIEDKNYFANEQIKADVKAQYLAGGALSDAPYNASWYKTPVEFNPDTVDSKDYTFGPILEYASTKYVATDKGKLNSNGVVQQSVKTVSDNDGQAYKYKIEVSVKDVSNQTIFSSESKIVHPARFYIGVKNNRGNSFYTIGDTVKIPFAIFDVEGNFLTEKSIKENFSNEKIKVELTKESWSYVNKSAVDGVYSSWQKNIEKIKSFEVLANQKSQAEFIVDQPGFYTVTFTAKDKNSNIVKTEQTFFVTGNNYFWRNRNNEKLLNLTPNKTEYKIGETAKILLQSPLQSGDYLVTVEREAILDSKIIHIDSGCTQIELPIKAEYLPVVYVSVCSCSPRTIVPPSDVDAIDSGKPKGYYGVTKICTNLETVLFDVDIELDKKSYKPGEKITIDLTATKNNVAIKDAELALLVVDRAVTDLIDYHVKNPIETFYDHDNFRLCVTGSDSRNFLMDPIVYKIKNLQGGDKGDDEVMAKSLARAENDSSFMDQDGKVRKDFRPTAFFDANIITDKNGKAKVSFTLPDSLTTYRITVVGINKNNFSLTEKEFVAQNSINVQPIQPRRMRTRDTAEVGILLTNNEAAEKEVKIDFEILSPQKNYLEDIEQGLITKKGEAFIEGQNSVSVKIQPKKTMPVYFTIAAKKEGNVELVYKVKSDVLNEKLISRMIIEKANSYETVATTNFINEQSETVNEQFVIPSWAQDNDGLIQLTLDPTQLGVLSEAVNYVFEYPYGCLEQQSAKILPLILFEKYIDVFGMKSKVENPRKLILSWFNKIKDEQKNNGAFPYWSGGRESNFVSLRFAHIYYIAKQNGFSDYQIGYDINLLLTYIKSNVSKFSKLENAYACYIFSLFNDNSLDDNLEQLYLEVENSKKTNSIKIKENSLSKMCYLALSYQNKNDLKSKQKFDTLLKLIRENILPIGRGVSLELFETSKSYFGDMFNSESESLALILQLLVKDNPKDELVNKVLFSLLQTQRQGYWQSTSTTAKVFESISVLIKVRKLEELNFISTAVIKNNSNNVELMNEKFVGLNSREVTKTFDFTNEKLINIPRNELTDLEITKKGNGSLYYTMLMKYAIPAETICSRDEGFETILVITDEDGKIVEPESKDSKVIILESGKTYNFSASVYSDFERKFVAIKMPVPSGCEIADRKLSTGGAKDDDFDESKYFINYFGDYNDYECLYDNEAQFFKNSFGRGTVNKEITVRATRKGVYPTPPVFVECMYEPEIFGRTDGYLFIVK